MSGVRVAPGVPHNIENVERPPCRTRAKNFNQRRVFIQVIKDPWKYIAIYWERGNRDFVLHKRSIQCIMSVELLQFRLLQALQNLFSSSLVLDDPDSNGSKKEEVVQVSSEQVDLVPRL